jgi:RNA polymerase sigma-70 factor (ECF subfamily)
LTFGEEHLLQLMRRSLRGDARAHEAMLRLLAPILRSYFRRRIRGNEEDVEDLVQESLIAIHTRRSTYDPSRPLSPWVFAIAKYKFVDFLRRRKRAGASVELTEECAWENPGDDASARLDIESVLATLPDKQARAIRSMQINGETAGETAARFGWSESDAKVSAHRGLKSLRARFSGDRT